MIENAYICKKLAIEIRNQASLGDAFGVDPLGWAVNAVARVHPSWLFIAPDESARIPFMACDQLHALLPAIGLSADLDALIGFTEAWDGTESVPEGEYEALAYRAGNEFAHALRAELADA